MAQSQQIVIKCEKTHYMIFHGKRKPYFHITLRIDGESINEVDKTKFPGVNIDNKLTWKSHITHICGKVARGIGVIIKARKWLNQDSLISLYYSFIYPYLIYCNHVWGPTSKTNIEPLPVLQKNNHSNYCGSKTKNLYWIIIWSVQVLKMYQDQQIFDWAFDFQDS